MAKTTQVGIKNEILTALRKIRKNKYGNSFITAYQLLRLLSKSTRDTLNQEYGLSGKGAGHSFSAASFVAKAAASYPEVDVERLDTRGMRMEVDGKQVEAGTEMCGLFRLRADS